MNDRIKEKLAFYRILLSFTLIAIFGIIGWVWGVFFKVGYKIDAQFYIACCVLFLVVLYLVFVVKFINKLFKKL